MSRQLRHHYAGGWYHITARGVGRREIFVNDRDRAHFVELLQGVVERLETDMTVRRASARVMKMLAERKA